MVKYSAIILLTVVALFWSPVTARPKIKRDAIDELDQKGIAESIKEAIESLDILPEPLQSKASNWLRENEKKHWNSYQEFTAEWFSFLKKLEKLADKLDEDPSSVNSDSYEKIEQSDDDIVDVKAIYKKITDSLVEQAPLEYKTILQEKYEEVIEGDYKDFVAFAMTAENIFKQVTGRDSEPLQ